MTDRPMLRELAVTGSDASEVGAPPHRAEERPDAAAPPVDMARLASDIGKRLDRILSGAVSDRFLADLERAILEDASVRTPGADAAPPTTQEDSPSRSASPAQTVDRPTMETPSASGVPTPRAVPTTAGEPTMVSEPTTSESIEIPSVAASARVPAPPRPDVDAALDEARARLNRRRVAASTPTPQRRRPFERRETREALSQIAIGLALAAASAVVSVLVL